jgi:hypothetical protein
MRGYRRRSSGDTASGAVVTSHAAAARQTRSSQQVSHGGARPVPGCRAEREQRQRGLEPGRD